MSSAFRCRGTARAATSVLHLERLRRLCLVRMLGPRVDLQLHELAASQPVLREHAADGDPQDLLRAPLELLAQGAAADSAGVAGMPVVALLVELVPRDG